MMRKPPSEEVGGTSVTTPAGRHLPGELSDLAGILAGPEGAPFQRPLDEADVDALVCADTPAS